VVKTAEYSRAISTEGASLERGHPGESERIEHLECLVAQLLIRNQTIRFELHASRQRFEQLNQLLVDIDAHSLDRMPRAELLLVLVGLRRACRSPEVEAIEMPETDRNRRHDNQGDEVSPGSGESVKFTS
jgi:hypothetical protein